VLEAWWALIEPVSYGYTSVGSLCEASQPKAHAAGNLHDAATRPGRSYHRGVTQRAVMTWHVASLTVLLPAAAACAGQGNGA
jgi:hypothetical protein